MTDVYLDELGEIGYYRITDGDELVFEHQLAACVDHDPYDVFSPSTQVHHQNNHRFDNRSENLDVLSDWHHRLLHNRGEVVEDDDGEGRIEIVSEDVTGYGASD